ncbi:YbbR-like domain-containing protein [Mucilaginibacter corticis]|uniref:YbbR-like domain-containing protein n=1 Tax=Mucilaginibacter corticis TaxID=2597670 RepID=A0A556MKZ8_9SPHI|nr:CdaR family protein [Mucilaginibacter corticis]TSJ40563.1 YbbR-like domain-containing protein [Mucilaginibacter corticis]
MAIVKLSATERRRASAFFTCLILALCAWIAITLSNSYDYQVKEVLVFKNSPQKRAFHPLQSDTVTATVKGNGWQMLFSKMNEQNRIIKVDLSKLDSEAYVVVSTQLNAINAEKAVDNEIIAIAPDTLYFDFTNRSDRKVPVQLVKSVNYQQQFTQSGNIVIKPAYVRIIGPSNVIDKIKFWRTDQLTLKNINEDVNTEVNLQAPDEGNVSIYPKTVQVSIPVDEFTEKTIELPVKLVGNVDFYNVKVFPQKVKVTFTTSLNRYADIDEEFFEAQADLNLWRAYGYSSLPVKVTRLPDYCKIVNIEPHNIDFIVKK